MSTIPGLRPVGHGLESGHSFGWGVAATDSEDGRRFLQHRFLLFASLVAVLSGLFLPIMRGLEAAGSQPLRSWAVTSLSPFNLAGTLLSAVLCLVLWRGRFSMPVLRAGEALFAFAVCGCWIGMGFTADQGVHSEFFVLLAVSDTLLGRAALIPSDARRTLGVSFVASVSVVAATFVIHRQAMPAAALVDRLAFTAMGLAAYRAPTRT